MSDYLKPKQFGELFNYSRSTVAQWLPGMRRDGVAFGEGKATRVHVEAAKRWITDNSKRVLVPILHVVRCEVRQ